MKLSSDTIPGFLLRVLVVLLLGIGAILFFFFVYLPNYTNQGETVTVPDLEGIHMDQIDEFLVKRNLRYEINDSSYSDKYPPLTILKQYPKAGSKVKENRKVFISVNRVNPPTVPVPELVDRSLRNAQAVLKSNELNMGKIRYTPSPFLNLVVEMRYDGEPIDQGERIPKGSVIDLVVGDGCSNCSFKAPDVIGNALDEAKFIILGSNLQIGMINVEGDTTDTESIIIDQNPSPGRRVKVGDILDLWIAPPSDTVGLSEKRSLLNN